MLRMPRTFPGMQIGASMPIRFRRQIKVAPGVKLNLSKSGVSTTVGSKGLHFNISKRGIKRTMTIPGTGISEVDYVKKTGESEEKKEEKKEKAAERREERLEEKREEKGTHAAESESTHARRSRRAGGSLALRNAFVLLGVVVFFFAGAAMLGLVPAHFFSNSLAFLAHLVQTAGH